MDLTETKNILGDRALWELKNMKKALEMISIFNTAEENKRLEAVNFALKHQRAFFKN